MSSHNPALQALNAVKTGLIDVLMFSINPAYDLLPEDTRSSTDLSKTESYQQGDWNGIEPGSARSCIQHLRSHGRRHYRDEEPGCRRDLLKAKTSPFGHGADAGTVHPLCVDPSGGSQRVGAAPARRRRK